MKRINTFLALSGTVAMFALALTTSAWAQAGRGGQGPEQGVRAERQLAYLHENLDLTNAQLEQVRAILDTHRTNATAWFQANRNASRDERAAFRTQHFATLKAELQEVLNDEQETDLDAVLSRFAASSAAGRLGPRGAGRDFRGGGRGLRGTRSPLARLERRLELTDEQVEQFRALQTQHREEVRAWMSENPDATPDERRAFLNEHRNERQTALESILTPQQVEKMNSLRQDRQDRGRQGHRRPDRGSRGGIGG